MFGCPHEGCDSIAIGATDASFGRDGGYIWECAAGHHGPWFVSR